MLNLRQAVAIMEKSSPEEFANNQDVIDFIKDIGLASREIIHNIPDEDLLSAAEVIKGGIIGGLIQEGSIGIVIALMGDQDAFETVVAESMKIILGLREVEGWK